MNNWTWKRDTVSKYNGLDGNKSFPIGLLDMDHWILSYIDWYSPINWLLLYPIDWLAGFGSKFHNKHLNLIQSIQSPPCKIHFTLEDIYKLHEWWVGPYNKDWWEFCKCRLRVLNLVINVMWTSHALTMKFTCKHVDNSPQYISRLKLRIIQCMISFILMGCWRTKWIAHKDIVILGGHESRSFNEKLMWRFCYLSWFSGEYCKSYTSSHRPARKIRRGSISLKNILSMPAS